ncbi:hypothetical protein BH10PLA1_BH10PLA1_10440 [soil metagenome]
MGSNRPALLPAYVLGAASVFCTAGAAIALLGNYVEVSVATRNVILVAIIGLDVGIIAALSAAVSAAQSAARLPSYTRDLNEMREQLSHIGSMLRDREPKDDEDEALLHENVARLQANTAQSQQELSQVQEMLRQVIAKLDSLHSVATTPSPAAVALDREADDSGIFPAINGDENGDGIDALGNTSIAAESDAHAIPSPAFIFRPVNQPDEVRAEHFNNLEECRSRVDDLMALSNWDVALATANQYAQQHPEDADAQWLRTRVQREYDIYREGSVRRLYEQIKEELERKHYRRALSIARRLLDKFADHKKSQKIRQQLPTILENAEIEERQEDETRIQSFIKSKRFQDAVELGEALLNKYPMSPQAESLEEMLPRLRQLAIEQEAETIGRR